MDWEKDIRNIFRPLVPDENISTVNIHRSKKYFLWWSTIIITHIWLRLWFLLCLSDEELLLAVHQHPVEHPGRQLLVQHSMTDAKNPAKQIWTSYAPSLPPTHTHTHKWTHMHTYTTIAHSPPDYMHLTVKQWLLRFLSLPSWRIMEISRNFPLNDYTCCQR